ncbi:hypothetical protein A3J19_02425 [Candidatus Daviesbacteria bacterium RIFCSPLOWO2_02_FULL_41_8]|uniref:Uncharacterized protein n=1 Tax=Candidatus Daviesbacteria bacterium RIFCSPLOWO2_02_FULL_41_8 TaxID=1797798 RepID=A0A1F5NMF6_9BACT|nr:MAG: hypothetical protein A3J19_02425 [Candidatus Daviesbacteria bacterium RIFCSPLOWO2_02_FULL_41_8]
MGRETLSRAAFVSVAKLATAGGTRSATAKAEERARNQQGMDPLVDPKGLAHLGPIRRSLPRFDKQGNLWVLTCGMPMAEETLLDTTGSMENNVDLAFEALPHSYEMYTTGKAPVLGRYDVQIATAIFNDVEDQDGIPVLCRSQFEMGEKIALQMTKLVPGRGGCGNGKEDSQFGIFGATYLTTASINRYELKYYHFTVSDEPIVPVIDPVWLLKIFGDDVFECIKETGYEFDRKGVPDTAQAVRDLQKKAHAFFLQVNGRSDVHDQWIDLYGSDHFVALPFGTEHLHCVKAAIIGLTEGVLDLSSAEEFLRNTKVDGKKMQADQAKRIVRAVAHIPLGAQAALPNFGKLPKAGDLFRDKIDLWPVSEEELQSESSVTDEQSHGGVRWL